MTSVSPSLGFPSNEVEVAKDFKASGDNVDLDAFVNAVKGVLATVGTCRFKKIVVSAGQFRFHDYRATEDGETLIVDFYFMARDLPGCLRKLKQLLTVR